jgi:general secretion pathway protein J
VSAKIGKRCGGFTLIEVILAISIFSLIAVILYGALYLGRRAVDKGTSSTAAAQKERMLGSFLSNYVRSAFPYRASPQDPSVFFHGEESSMAFVSALSRGLGGRGMAKVTVAWDGRPGSALTLEEEMPVRVLGAEPSGGYRNRVVLYPAVDEFQVDYLAPEGPEDQWVERWDGAEKKTLPRAVRFHLRAAGRPEKEWVLPIMIKALIR